MNARKEPSDLNTNQQVSVKLMVHANHTWIEIITAGKVSTMTTQCSGAPTIICDNSVFNRTENRKKEFQSHY